MKTLVLALFATFFLLCSQTETLAYGDATSASCLKSFLVDYLLEEGTRINCSFTIERSYKSGLQSPLYGYIEGSMKPANIDDLVLYLSHKLPSVSVYRDKNFPMVVHLVDRSLLESNWYTLNQVKQIKFVGTAKQMVVNKSNEWGVLPGWENVTGFVSLDSGKITNFPLVGTLTLDVFDKDVLLRDVLTQYSPFSTSSRILWMVGVDTAARTTRIRFYNSTSEFGLKESNFYRTRLNPKKQLGFNEDEFSPAYGGFSQSTADDAIKFIESSSAKSQTGSLRWAMIYLGKYQVANGISILIKHLDYEFAPSPFLEERYPALSSLSRIGQPAVHAALEELPREKSLIRLELLCHVVFGVLGKDEGVRYIRVAMTSIQNGKQRDLVMNSLNKALQTRTISY